MIAHMGSITIKRVFMFSGTFSFMLEPNMVEVKQ